MSYDLDAAGFRTALVTGAASDIGLAICRELAAAGFKLLATDVALDRMRALEDRLPGAQLVSADLTATDDVSELARTPVDVLVSVAGLAEVDRFLDADPERWDALWRVNLRAPMAVTQALLPGMLERGAGRLVYISSDSARAGAGGESVYAATKAGLFGFVKSIAREVAVNGITANVVCPGVIDTARSRTILADRPRMREALERAIPARKLGSPEDVAGAVAYLCSDQAAYVTGQILSVNGGMVMA